ncbi:hypothetical protein FRC17_004959 [Serendipita sp. 399]|nr:hypothetical protein FRC17_004959 [Serendipita sp. 399]
MPQLEKISAGDCVVAVMGLTGSGKTSFIAKACNEGEEYINPTLTSQKPNIRTFVTNHPRTNKRIVFVDTPGFDDTASSDTETLTQISNWLYDAHNANAHLSAILYLHPIHANRVARSARVNLEVFAALCGKSAMPNVILVTTMWDLVPQEVGEIRVEELKRRFWSDMLECGGTTKPFRGTFESAWEILNDLPKTGADLEIQKERKRGKSLHMTKAFSALNTGLLSKWIVDIREMFHKVGGEVD